MPRSPSRVSLLAVLMFTFVVGVVCGVLFFSVAEELFFSLASLWLSLGSCSEPSRA